MESKNALISGISGQVASYLAEFLLDKGYDVFGLIRRHASDGSLWRIEHILDRINLIEGDLTDQSSLANAVEISSPDEAYNCGAQSFVGVSWKQPEYTANVTGLGALRLLEVVRKWNTNTRFFQSSSSEMFGNSPAPQNEETPLKPVSPYGCAKTFAHNMVQTYRKSYDMFCCSGIAFNMESPRRGSEFVTRKIATGVAKIHYGSKDKIYLGNIDSERDWGYAPEYVKAMWLMLQQDKPDDYVIATEETHSIREFLDQAFNVIGINDWDEYVNIDKSLFRPAEVNKLIGDCSKIKKKFGWYARTQLKDLVKIMVNAEIKRLEKCQK